MGSSLSSLLNRLKHVSLRSYHSHINGYSKIISPAPPELHTRMNSSMLGHHDHHWRRSISTRPLPMLMLPEDHSQTTNSNPRDFFDISSNYIYTFLLPELDRSWRCCGSSEGWLVFMDTKSFKIRLFDPMSKSEKHLPPIDALTNEEIDDPPNGYAAKVVLSSDPNSPHGYMAMAIAFGKLFFFKSGGEEKWTAITTPWDPFQDVIYSNGMFYAISRMGPIVSFDIMANPCKVTEISKGRPGFNLIHENELDKKKKNVPM